MMVTDVGSPYPSVLLQAIFTWCPARHWCSVLLGADPSTVITARGPLDATLVPSYKATRTGSSLSRLLKPSRIPARPVYPYVRARPSEPSLSVFPPCCSPEWRIVLREIGTRETVWVSPP